MKLAKSVLYSPTTLCLVIFLLLIYILVSTQWEKIKITPSGYTFSGAHGYYPDYYHYMAAIEQGKSGYWLFQNPHAVESSLKPTSVHLAYIIVGKIAGILKIGNITAYWIFLTFSGFILAVSSYIFLKLSVPKSLIPASLLFSLFGTTWPPATLRFFGIEAVGKAPEWWTEQSSPYFRFITAPHHMLSESLLVIAFLLIIYYFTRRKNILYLWLAGFINFISIIIFPIPGLVFIISLTLFRISGPLMQKVAKVYFDRKTYIGFMFIIILSVFGLIFMTYELSKVSPKLTSYIGLVVSQELQRSKEYGFIKIFLETLIIFGPLLLFFPFGVLDIMKKAIPTRLLALFWILTILIIFPILLPFLGVGITKGIISAPFIPVAVVSVLGMRNVSLWISRKVKFLSFNTVILILTLSYLFISLPTVLFFWKLEKPVWATTYYLPADSVKTYEFIKKNLKKKSIILTGEYVGTIMPSFTPVLTPVAVEYGTYEPDRKKRETEEFYSGKMSRAEAVQFLKKYNINYIFLGWDEDDWGDLKEYHDLIEPIFNSGKVYLYKVI